MIDDMHAFFFNEYMNDDTETSANGFEYYLMLNLKNSRDLSALVLEYLPAGRLRPTAPPQIVARMLELARKLAPIGSDSYGPAGTFADMSNQYSNPHDPGAYTLVDSPAQTGEAGAARFVPDEKPKRLCPHGVEMDVSICGACFPMPWETGA